MTMTTTTETKIRPWTTYDEAAEAAFQAGFRFANDSNQGSSGRSHSPTLYYKHPFTGEEIEILWAHGRGYIRRLA
jgi:hypothetical protein